MLVLLFGLIFLVYEVAHPYVQWFLHFTLEIACNIALFFAYEMWPKFKETLGNDFKTCNYKCF